MGVGVRNQSGNERDSNGGGITIGSDVEGERIARGAIGDEERDTVSPPGRGSRFQETKEEKEL
jgi:hypothetical protein